jgi:serine/threonine protein kinase
MNTTHKKDEIENPLFIMRCQSYYYEKKLNEKSNENGFTLNFVYPLAKRDLFELIKDLRKAQFNFPEEKVIPLVWQVLRALLQLKIEFGIRHRDLKP